ncbi:hypothetical protein V8G54_033773 [Vigna mungo]|uniref:Disease resistance protein At4g27190-like leucine-rich repeats domain-containing protein n=1 Tax=Vigna mungo TaxID=3915 RepID=A0AAQ3MPJ4_VIGMU
MNVEKLWHWNYPSKSFCELENLSLTNNNKLLTAISSNMVTRFKNLRKLTLNKCELLTEVFDFEDDNLDHKIHEILPQLEVLALINLINLKYLWNKEPQVSFFSNLVSIYIFYCHNLKSLFSLSSIKNLGKLKILRLCKCDKIEEVISSDISEDENVSIIFPKLECLVMMDLPMLTSFYRQSTTLSLPKLKRVRMSNIPKMKTFSRGILITSLLRSIYVTFVNKIWFGSFNNTISHMHDNPGTFKYYNIIII